jgi:hypothetical protein
MVPEMSVTFSHLTGLMAQYDFVIIYRESFRSTNISEMIVLK